MSTENDIPYHFEIGVHAINKKIASAAQILLMPSYYSPDKKFAELLFDEIFVRKRSSLKK